LSSRGTGVPSGNVVCAKGERRDFKGLDAPPTIGPAETFGRAGVQGLEDLGAGRPTSRNGSTMSNIFRKSYTLPIQAGAELVTVKGVPSARFKRKGKTITAPLTEKGDRVRVLSPSFYGTVAGKPIRLFTDAVASQQRLAELLR